MNVAEPPSIRLDAAREAIARLCEDHMQRCGTNTWYRTPPFPGQLCTFVNPFCPDDLCTLPAGHVGVDLGLHVTGTAAYDHAIQFREPSYVAGGNLSRRQLIMRGAALANRTWPEKEQP